MTFLNKIFNLKDKTVVVTGAKGQLGSKICEGFYNCGSKVIGLDIKDAPIFTKVDGVKYIDADITNKNELQNVLEKVVNDYQTIDILINNAGVSTFEPFEKRPEDKIDWVMDVNLKGTFFCIQAYVNLFDKYKFKKGVIVNIGSVYGMVSPDFRIYTDCPRKNSEIYGATKAGIIQMTKYFAVWLAERNIRVNAVSPGGIFNSKNPQGKDFVKNYSYRCPMKRMAKDSEVMAALLYLASDAASYTTGQNIAIDGGFSCW